MQLIMKNTLKSDGVCQKYMVTPHIFFSRASQFLAYPTDPFTTLPLKSLSLVVPELHNIFGSPDPEAS